MIWIAHGRRWYEWFHVISLRFCMTWTTPSHELTTLDTMKNSRLWLTWTTSSHELRVLDAMKSLELWMIWMTQDPMSSYLKMLWTSPGQGWYEQLKAMVNMNDSGSWAQGFKCDEQLWTLDVINSSGLWMTWTTLDHELRIINSTHNSRLWLTWKIPIREL